MPDTYSPSADFCTRRTLCASVASPTQCQGFRWFGGRKRGLGCAATASGARRARLTRCNGRVQAPERLAATEPRQRGPGAPGHGTKPGGRSQGPEAQGATVQAHVQGRGPSGAGHAALQRWVQPPRLPPRAGSERCNACDAGLCRVPKCREASQGRPATPSPPPSCCSVPEPDLHIWQAA